MPKFLSLRDAANIRRVAAKVGEDEGGVCFMQGQESSSCCAGCRNKLRSSSLVRSHWSHNTHSCSRRTPAPPTERRSRAWARACPLCAAAALVPPPSALRTWQGEGRTRRCPARCLGLVFHPCRCRGTQKGSRSSTHTAPFLAGVRGTARCGSGRNCTRPCSTASCSPRASSDPDVLQSQGAMESPTLSKLSVQSRYNRAGPKFNTYKCSAGA